MNADGKVDLVYDFAKHLLQSTLFVDDPDATPNFDDDGNLVSILLTGSAETVSDHIAGHYGKFDLTLSGDFSLNEGVTPETIEDPEDMDGTVTGISISHTPSGSSESAVIASNDGLSFTWSELMDNMDNAMPGGDMDDDHGDDDYYDEGEYDGSEYDDYYDGEHDDDGDGEGDTTITTTANMTTITTAKVSTTVKASTTTTTTAKAVRRKASTTAKKASTTTTRRRR